MSDEKPFVNKPQTVTLANGDEITLPRLTLKRIVAVTDSMTALIETAQQKVPEIFEIFNGGNTMDVGMKIVKALPTVFPMLLKEVIGVLSDYIDKDENYILENMDMEDLVAIATPFFANILAQGNHLVEPLGHLFGKAKTSSESSPN